MSAPSVAAATLVLMSTTRCAKCNRPIGCMSYPRLVERARKARLPLRNDSSDHLHPECADSLRATLSRCR